jgi:precorrin-2 dehydrogenase/sirohydrochlorin ferrochelatase
VRFGYPIMLDVTDRLVVIVGGGSVAVRKARGVLEAGAKRVRCVAAEIDPAMPPPVQRVAEQYDARHLDGAGLVFAATDTREVNDAVVRDAQARGALVSRADHDEARPGDFTTPAKLRQGPVTVAVSAGGSPSLAVLIRDGLLERWDLRWTLMAEMMQSLRREITVETPDPLARREAFRALATEEALDVLERAGVQGVKDWLSGRHSH